MPIGQPNMPSALCKLAAIRRHACACICTLSRVDIFCTKLASVQGARRYEAAIFIHQLFFGTYHGEQPYQIFVLLVQPVVCSWGPPLE